MPVFCCFPGTGKSYFAQQDHRVIDLESSDFKFGGNHSHRDYDTTRSKQATWPYNYVERIQELAPSNIVFASTRIEMPESSAMKTDVTSSTFEYTRTRSCW